jgi:hypothetical protein
VDDAPRRQRSPAMRPDELERRLQARLEALGPTPGAELLHVLMLPDFERADRIGEFWGYSESRAFAQLPDRLRGGPDASGGAHWDAAGELPLDAGNRCEATEPSQDQACTNNANRRKSRPPTRIQPRAHREPVPHGEPVVQASNSSG